MVVVEVVRSWTEPGLRVELPGIPHRGDVVVINDDGWDGTVQEVVWEPGKPVIVRIG